jgi:F-type H+-transporting ATPase subunit b
MLIDWFTVGAQALNFLVLVWLLRRYLYRPVIAAIDAREKQIADASAEAASQRAAADQERLTWAGKNSSLESERKGLLAAARQAADVERERLLAEARAASNTLRAERLFAEQEDQKRLGKDLGQLARTEVLAIARKVLGDLADASLEERAIEVFVHRLRAMDAATKTALQMAFLAMAEVTLTSSFELSGKQRVALQTAIDEALDRSTSVRFETSSDLVCGVRLSAGGEQVAWSVADYLDALDRKVDAFLAARFASAVLPVSTPGVAVAIQ